MPQAFPALPAPGLSGPPAGKVGTKQRVPSGASRAQRAGGVPGDPGTLGFCLGLPYFSSRGRRRPDPHFLPTSLARLLTNHPKPQRVGWLGPGQAPLPSKEARDSGRPREAAQETLPARSVTLGWPGGAEAGRVEVGAPAADVTSSFGLAPAGSSSSGVVSGPRGPLRQATRSPPPVCPLLVPTLLQAPGWGPDPRARSPSHAETLPSQGFPPQGPCAPSPRPPGPGRCPATLSMGGGIG